MSEYKKRKGIIQFTQFSLIGILNGTIDLGALNLLLLMWPTQTVMGLFLFNSIAYVLAVLNSYFWNSRLTFRLDVFFSVREKIIFVAQATVSLLISNGVFLLFIYWFGLFPIPLWIIHNASKGLSMAISSTSSFFFMKYFVFSGSRSRG
ncbi:MAG: polysaccharide synthesis protein GtrA [Bacilli bacterium]|nr:polysaccharide synthesis protein GtrA [Bacilli bacterium]